ncbi:alpha-hydroxy-acid oxidizing protein, partial [Pseudorhodoplanes sp.]|uniref:alpha-hydroxy acid oxidase n=1 Tax=Pseudorhodoplanes sp. TaxID=1934341 RepID=UPI00391BDB35
MHDRTAVKGAPTGWGVAGNSREAQLRRRFPTVEDLRKASARRIPSLGYETVAGGNGQNLGVERNADALDAIELVPRIGADKGPVATDVTLFGRHYAAPLGIAPMGLQSVFWPGAERHLARAAQRARIPYTAGTVSGIALEEAAALAPDVVWFQLYRLARDDHRVGFDLVRRAQDAGVHVLVMTVDTPGRAKRPGELRNGLTLPFRPTLRTIMEAAVSPGWMQALLQNGQPGFPCLAPYCGENAGNADIAWFAQSEVGGAFTFEELKRYRDVWNGPMVIKGVMHPADAETAVAIGLDGVQVSNHGGRQLEAAPAAIDVLPAVVRAVGSKATVLFDSGVRSGLDAVRAVALGAQAALAGRAFLY